MNLTHPYCLPGEHSLTHVVTNGYFGEFLITIYCTRCPFHYDPRTEFIHGQAKAQEEGQQEQGQEAEVASLPPRPL